MGKNEWLDKWKRDRLQKKLTFDVTKPKEKKKESGGGFLAQGGAGASEPKPEQKAVSAKPSSASVLDDPGKSNKVLLAIILSIIGGFIGLFIPAYGFAGIGLLVLAGYITKDIKNFWPFFGITIGVVLLPYVGFVISFAVMLISITASLFTFSGSKFNVSRIFMHALGTAFSIVFSLIATGFSIQNTIFLSCITIGIVTAGYINGSTDIKGHWRIIGSIASFGPLLFLAGWWLFVTGSVMFGNFGDVLQHNLRTSLGVGSGGLFDMILDPKLATQMFYKPPTVRADGSTPFLTTTPSVSFTTSSSVIPQGGCFETTYFQIIARLKNTGDVYISDVDLYLVPEFDFSFSNPCNNIELTLDGETGSCAFNQRSVPQGSTLSETCYATVPRPPITEGMAESSTCFVDVKAVTGYHSVSRLPVEVIESSYARSQFEQGRLTTSIVPTTVGQGPIELSVGGIEQPIWATTKKGTLLVSLSNTGNGVVSEYLSVILYIPDELLKSGSCGAIDPDFFCYKNIYKLGNAASDPIKAFIKYIDEDTIGGYRQVSYDNSYDELIKTHHICFYAKPIDTSNPIIMATCNIELVDNIIDEETTRKTFIIRGDVLYTYEVSSDALITVRDCEGVST